MWLLIDGNNWFARDFYASGTSCGHNFLKRLEDLKYWDKTERIAIAWDSRSFRHDLVPSYKAGRKEKPDGFARTLSELRDRVAGLDCYSIAVDGFEADDLLAAMAASAIDEGVRAMIFSSDRDLHQCLVADRVNQVTQISRVLANGIDLVITTAANLFEKHGVHPYQWIDYRTMIGDKSDNIAGCPGLGPVAAAEVLRACGSLDRFYHSPFTPALTARQRNALLAFKEKIPTTQTLLTLSIDAPLPVGWTEGVVL